MTDKEIMRLTHMSSKAGWASKLGPEDLAQVLCHLKKRNISDPDLLVGFETSDDAGVYRISPDTALIQTVDFFTPVVDDPYIYGQIAAANALSDVYAMGGKPLTVMNIACFSCSLDSSILADILRGGADKINEAGAILVGGHTVTDKEIKYGLSVTGVVHPSRVVANSGAKPGDVLILTKPIGTGILTTAFKHDYIGEKGLEEAVKVMATLNKNAAEAMQRIGVSACTDITGFGLIGHSYEMAGASGVEFRLFGAGVPIMADVIRLIGEDAVPGGAHSNYRYFEKWTTFAGNIGESQRIALFDPQTSGGLLISVPKERADSLMRELKLGNVEWSAVIGEVVEKGTLDNIINVV